MPTVATDEDIIEAVMMCSSDKGFTTYGEVAEIVGITPTTLIDRMKELNDIIRETGKYNGCSRTLITLPKEWP